MPSARLITHAIEEAEELAADLRHRGFVVEVVSPDDIPAHSVDLQVRLEESSTEEALRSAEELSKTEDLHVFIAPGAIVESLRPIISVPLEFASEEPVLPALVESEDLIAPVETVSESPAFALSAVEEPAHGAEVTNSDESLLQEAPWVEEAVHSEPSPLFEASVEQITSSAPESQQVSPVPSESQPLEMFVREEDGMAEDSQPENPVLPEEISAAPDHSPMGDFDTPVEQLPAYALESQEPAVPTFSESDLANIFARAEQATAEIPSSDHPALGEEIFPREDEQPAPTLETPVEESPAYALQRQEAFPPSDWPIWTPLAEEEQPELAAVSAPAMAAASSRRSMGTFTRARSNDRLFWRLAIVASVVAVSTMLLGVSAHRFSPIPRGLAADNGGLPFTSKTQAPTAETVAEALPEVTPSASEFKRVLVHMPVADRPSSAEHLGSRVERPKHYQRAATRGEDDSVAKDTVVRFGKKSETARMESQKKPGIRHYSDLH